MIKKNFLLIAILLFIVQAVIFLIVLGGLMIKSSSLKIDKPARAPEILKEQIEQKSTDTKAAVSLIAVGDIMLSRNVGQKMLSQKNYAYPFLALQDYLKSGDVVLGNLETAITPGKIVKTGEMMFRADTSTATTLKEVGFSILSLANNHTPNYGQVGLLDTFKYLKTAGLDYVGAGFDEQEAYQPVFITKNNVILAFVAQNDYDVVPDNYRATKNQAGTALFDQEKLKTAIAEAKSKADFVIFVMHSGTEYKPLPNEKQKKFAYLAIDSGADLVIGHHPHVVQTLEQYQGKYIFYSLGNFVFDQMWSEDTKQGLMVKIELVKNEGVKEIKLLPIEIYDYAQPRVAVGAVKDKIIKRLKYQVDNQIIKNW